MVRKSIGGHSVSCSMNAYIARRVYTGLCIVELNADLALASVRRQPSRTTCTGHHEGRPQLPCHEPSRVHGLHARHQLPAGKGQVVENWRC